MSDEARIARLTELARRVWPDLDELRVSDAVRDAGCAVVDAQDGESVLAVCNHPRALDALEAALEVLAGAIVSKPFPCMRCKARSPHPYCSECARENMP